MDASFPIHPSIARDSRASSARSSFASLVRASLTRSPRQSTPPVTSFVQIGRRVFDSRVVRAARGRSSRSLAAFSEHFCSSGPTCLLIDRARAPMVFVGVTVPPEGETNRSERRPIRTFFESIRLLGFAPAVGPCRRCRSDQHRRCRGDRSCLGLCLSQGCRPRPEVIRLLRARVRVRPRIASSPPTRGSPAGLSAHGHYGVASRSNDRRDGYRRDDPLPARGCLRPSAKRLPFSVLWG
jgi:hypothetical protein